MIIRVKNDFDVLIIFEEIEKDIQKNRLHSFLSIIFFTFAVFVALPIALFFFFALFAKSYTILHLHNVESNYILFVYILILLYYYAIMHYENELYNIKDFKKSIMLLIFLILLALLSIFIHSSFIYLLFFALFIANIYFLSKSYYDIPLSKAYSMDKNLYRGDDLGLFGGYMNNPLSIQDDINRTQLSIQSSTTLFEFIALFIDMIIKNIIFLYAIRYKQYIHEAARAFDYILENNTKKEIESIYFSYPAKTILEVINYLSFRDEKIIIHKRGKEVAKKARR